MNQPLSELEITEPLIIPEYEDCGYCVSQLLEVNKKYGLACEVLYSALQSLGIDSAAFRQAIDGGFAEWDC